MATNPASYPYTLDMDAEAASSSQAGSDAASPSPTGAANPRRRAGSQPVPSRCYSREALYGKRSANATSSTSPPSTSPPNPYPGMTGLSTIMSVEPGEIQPEAVPVVIDPPPAETTWPSRSRNRNRSHSVTVNMARRPYQRLNRDVEAEGGGASPGNRSPNRHRATSDTRQSVSVRLSNDSLRDLDPGDDASLDDDMVGVLDCVDTEVGTANHLQNMTNGIMFPHIPALWNRRANVTLPSNADESASTISLAGSVDEEDYPPAPKRSRAGTLSRVFGKGDKEAIKPQPLLPTEAPEQHVMKDIVHDKLDDELESETDELAKEHDLDRHLKKVLAKQKRKEKIKAGLRGLWAFLKTPMGMVTAIYGFLVAFWGAAIVLFLLNWIPTSSKNQQDIWVEISSQVTNGLFTVTGVGLIPWRVIDTYRISVIWQYRKKIEKRRKAQGLEPIANYDDLPDPQDIPGYVNVLSTEEEKRLRYNQDKFSASQTWYKPHATATHTAFPMKYALWNTILMDGNSFFQCILCGTMWGMNRHKRPAWTTGTLIPLSFLCGIGAAVLIWQGGVRSKKTKQVEEKLRKALGVDEKVKPEVKKPRRATVSGPPPPKLDLPHRTKRSASIDVASDPAEVECFNRSHADHGLVADDLKAKKLGVVAETGDEDDAAKDTDSPELVLPSLPRQQSF